VRPDCRILLFSAAASELSKEAWADGHDFRLLQKPVHPDILLREIAMLQAQDENAVELSLLPE
jgi:hypothetical protein